MRVVLLGVAALLLSACASGRMCPMHVAVSGIGFDTTAYVATHPSAAKLCVAPGACQPVDHVFLPADGPGTTKLDLTIIAADGAVLLHATPTVRIRHFDGDRGCGNGSDHGSVTVAADGSVTSS